MARSSKKFYPPKEGAGKTAKGVTKYDGYHELIADDLLQGKSPTELHREKYHEIPKTSFFRLVAKAREYIQEWHGCNRAESQFMSIQTYKKVMNIAEKEGHLHLMIAAQTRIDKVLALEEAAKMDVVEAHNKRMRAQGLESIPTINIIGLTPESPALPPAKDNEIIDIEAEDETE